MNLFLKPISRSSDIVAQTLNDEILVYDLKTNQAISLNSTASKIWVSLDGKKTIAEIAKETNLPTEAIFLAIDELQRKNLLQENIETGLPKDKMSRRKIMVKLATAAVALPIIVGIIAPKAVQAASCVNAGGSPTGTTSQAGFSGLCSSGSCPAVCASFNSNCCSNTNNFAGTCTDNGGGAGVAVCDCVCG